MEKAQREAMGWDEMTFEQKKANGLMDGWETDVLPPEADPGVLDSTPAGWETFDLRGPLAGDEKLKADTMAFLTATVEKIAGPDVSIRFNDQTVVSTKQAAWGGDGKQVARKLGSYNAIRDLVTINGLLERDFSWLKSTAYHEAFHRVQMGLMNQQEMRAMSTAFGQTRISDYSKLAAGGKVSTIERMARAFETYADLRSQGFDPITELFRQEWVKAMDDNFPLARGQSWESKFTTKVAVGVFSAFNKVLTLAEQLRNWAQGNGFTSVDDFFERTWRGEVARDRTFDSAWELITPDQQERMKYIEAWSKDNAAARAQIGAQITALDSQIASLRAQALAGGC